MYNLDLKSTHKVDFTLHPADADGQPANLDPNTLAFANSNPAAATVAWNAYFQQATISGAAGGQTTITVSATSNGVPLIEEILVNVLPVVAVTFGIVFSTPVLK